MQILNFKPSISNSLGIYIHIPFCKNKCPYCDFNSYAVKEIPENDYTNSLIAELEAAIKKEPFIASKFLDTIYIGGGTPSIISPAYIGKILGKLFATFILSENPEITIEVNPATVDDKRLAGYKDCGINRLSIGVQSFDNKVLTALNRMHTAEDAVKAYNTARDSGFENIGIDLIFGVQGQDADMWLSDIEMAVAIKPEHISIYGLTIEHGTEFHRLWKKGDLTLPDEDTYIIMYEAAVERLKDADYIQYEISNFAVSGCASRHNMRYWNLLDYLGIGAGAHSFISDKGWGKRMWNEKDVFKYMEMIKIHGDAIAGMETLTKGKAISECMFLGLRQTGGLSARQFFERFDLSLNDRYAGIIPDLKNSGLIEFDGDVLKLTEKGLVLSDSVFAKFFN